MPGDVGLQGRLQALHSTRPHLLRAATTRAMATRAMPNSLMCLPYQALQQLVRRAQPSDLLGGAAATLPVVEQEPYYSLLTLTIYYYKNGPYDK